MRNEGQALPEYLQKYENIITSRSKAVNETQEFASVFPYLLASAGADPSAGFVVTLPTKVPKERPHYIVAVQTPSPLFYSFYTASRLDKRIPSMLN